MLVLSMVLLIKLKSLLSKLQSSFFVFILNMPVIRLPDGRQMAYAERDKGVFSKAWTWVEDKAKAVWDWGSSVVDRVEDKVDNVAKALNDDFKGVVQTIGNTANRAIDVTGGTISNVSSNLSMPLALGAVGLGAFLLLKK